MVPSLETLHDLPPDDFKFYKINHNEYELIFCRVNGGGRDSNLEYLLLTVSRNTPLHSNIIGYEELYSFQLEFLKDPNSNTVKLWRWDNNTSSKLYYDSITDFMEKEMS